MASSWSVPVAGPGGLSGIITVFRPEAGLPHRHELQLVTLYAGYAASAIERDRLLEQATARNRVLETIREMLETLAGPAPVAEGLVVAAQALRHGLQADEVALLTWPDGEDPQWRAFAGRRPRPGRSVARAARAAADRLLAETVPDGMPASSPANRDGGSGGSRSPRPTGRRSCWPAGSSPAPRRPRKRSR